MEQFQADFLSLPWRVRRELLEPVYELYEDDPDITRDDIYAALFYMTYGFEPTINLTPIAEVFKMFKIYKPEWVGIDP